MGDAPGDAPIHPPSIPIHLIRASVDKCRGALTAGAAVSADLVNIRIRPLPLRGTDLE